MPITVEDGTGLADADSYASVAGADVYHALRNVAAWAAAGTAAKEAALVRATAWIDATYRARFSGTKMNGRGQSLEWPRKDAKDAAGEDIGDNEVPREIAEATIEAALREVQSAGSLAPDVTPGQTKTLVQVGELRWKASGAGGATSQKPVIHAVDGILASLIGSGAGRLLRA